MKLSDREREVLNWLAREAQNLSNALKDASQLSEKGHYLTIASISSAIMLSDRIGASLDLLNSRIENKLEQLKESENRQ